MEGFRDPLTPRCEARPLRADAKVCRIWHTLGDNYAPFPGRRMSASK